ncbi:MAG TPA: hypothetical protein VHK63_03715 [Candidatus Limnocylindria bacterium]|nr:hypothetical protein [Candidatus Limnocylindria bacterium]
MNWALFAVQWLHVILGVMWFGAVLYNAAILIPALQTLPLTKQREFGAAIARQGFKVIRPVSIAVIVLGILRGTVFGPIQSVDALGTAYGITWLVALVLAIAAFLWAEFVIARALDRMNAIPEAEAIGPDGQPTPAFVAVIDDAKRKTVLELGFFLAIFTCMILMRFGL